MDRMTLLQKLERVAPALADNEAIPVLTQFCFTGTDVLAYNDQIGMSTPLKTEFKGTTPGATLLALLRASMAKEVVIEEQKQFLHIKAAGAKLKLPTMPEDAFVFSMPGDEGCPEVKDIGAFTEAMEVCTMSIGSDKAIPDQLGVTVIPFGKGVDLYATDFATVTHIPLELEVDSERAILPELFVRQAIELSKRAIKLYFNVFDDHALLVVEMDDGITSLFGRLLHSSDPMDFEKLLGEHLPAKMRPLLAPVPSKLQLILDRATVICDSKSDRYTTRVTVADGEIVFESKSDRGEVRDVTTADDKQKEVVLCVEPKPLRKAVDVFDQYLLTSKCVILTREDGAVFMAAALSDHDWKRQKED